MQNKERYLVQKLSLWHAQRQTDTHTDCSAWTTKMVSKYFIGLSYLSLRHDPVFSVIITRRTSSRRSNTVPRSSAAGTAICHWKSKTFDIPWSLVVTGSPVRCSSVGDNSHGLCVYGTVCNGLNACQEHTAGASAADATRTTHIADTIRRNSPMRSVRSTHVDFAGGG